MLNSGKGEVSPVGVDRSGADGEGSTRSSTGDGGDRVSITAPVEVAAAGAVTLSTPLAEDSLRL
jgi:hypothetical protein